MTIDKEAQRAEFDQVDLLGVKSDGSTVNLGKIAMPPRMKAMELAREQFGYFEEDDGSYAEMCFYALEQLIDHMQTMHKAAQAPLLERLRVAESNRFIAHVCDTCEGIGTIDETLGGYSFSNPKAQCPDCDGRGAYVTEIKGEGA